MKTTNNRYWNIFLAYLYGIASVILLISLLSAILILPTFLSWHWLQSVLRHSSSLNIQRQAGTLVFTSLIFSAIFAYKFLKLIYKAFENLEEKNVVNDKKIISLATKIAGDLGVPDFRKIYLTKDIGISTFYNRKGRYLKISLIALYYLNEEEIKSIIAHECGHHHHGAMLINRFAYRITHLFNCMFESLEEAEIQHKKIPLIHGGNYTSINNFINIVLFFPLFMLYLSYLKLINHFMNNANYEYYCDSVAMEYAGGNIFKSALQKMVDLGIAYQIICQEVYDRKIDVNSDDSLDEVYLKMLNRKYIVIQNNNTHYRREAYNISSDSHPSPNSRLRKAINYTSRKDLSSPMITQEKVKQLIHNLPTTNFHVLALNQLSLKAQESKIAEAQKSSGDAFIIIERRKEILNRYTFVGFGIVIDDKLERGVNNERSIRNNKSVKIRVTPGVHKVRIRYRLGLVRSKPIHIILSEKEKVQLICWTEKDDLYIAYKD